MSGARAHAAPLSPQKHRQRGIAKAAWQHKGLDTGAAQACGNARVGQAGLLVQHRNRSTAGRMRRCGRTSSAACCGEFECSSSRMRALPEGLPENAHARVGRSRAPLFGRRLTASATGMWRSGRSRLVYGFRRGSTIAAEQTRWPGATGLSR